MPPASRWHSHWHCKAAFSWEGLIQEGKPASNTPGASQTPAISPPPHPPARRETEAHCRGGTSLRRDRQSRVRTDTRGPAPAPSHHTPLHRPHPGHTCLLLPAPGPVARHPPPLLALAQRPVWITPSLGIGDRGIKGGICLPGRPGGCWPGIALPLPKTTATPSSPRMAVGSTQVPAPAVGLSRCSWVH